MTTMIKTFCQGCGTYCGDISLFDAPYTGEPICHDCSGENDWLSISTPIMPTFEVACLYYEICGATETFYSEEEYEIYGDDYVCPECYDQEEGALHGWDSFPMSLEYDEG